MSRVTISRHSNPAQLRQNPFGPGPGRYRLKRRGPRRSASTRPREACGRGSNFEDVVGFHYYHVASFLTLISGYQVSMVSCNCNWRRLKRVKCWNSASTSTSSSTRSRGNLSCWQIKVICFNRMNWKFEHVPDIRFKIEDHFIDSP